MNKKYLYDYIVIGSGSAGKIGALMASQSGFKTAIIEPDLWGGIDNMRILLSNLAMNFSKHIDDLKSAKNFQLSIGRIGHDHATVVSQRFLRAKNAQNAAKISLENANIDCFLAKPEFIDKNTIKLSPKNLTQLNSDMPNTITAEKILFAPSSQLAKHGIEIDSSSKSACFTPDNIFLLKKVPKSLFIIGAGKIGCEIAQYFANLGSEVIIADLSARILPKEDEEVGDLIAQQFTKNYNIKTLPYTRAIKITHDNISEKIHFIRNGQEGTTRAQAIVFANGFDCNFDAFNLSSAGLKFKKTLEISAWLQTNVKNIWAAGSCLGGINSSEKYEYQSTLAIANSINKTKNHANYNGFVRQTYTNPAVSTLGFNEDDCLRQDIKFKKIKVDLSETLFGQINPSTPGFIKILIDKQRKILGATLVVENSAVISQEIAFAIRHGMSIDSLANTPRINSSVTEIVRLAARQL